MNVKELLQSIPADVLAAEYLCYHPDYRQKLLCCEADTTGLREKFLECIRKDIAAICAMEPQTNDGVLFASSMCSQISDGALDVVKVSTPSLLSGNFDDRYAVEFMPYTEMLGMRVSEASIAVYGKNAVACAILYAMLMFPVDKRDYILDSLWKASQGPSKPWGELVKELAIPERSEAQQELDMGIIEAEADAAARIFNLLAQYEQHFLRQEV